MYSAQTRLNSSFCNQVISNARQSIQPFHGLMMVAAVGSSFPRVAEVDEDARVMFMISAIGTVSTKSGGLAPRFI